MLQITIKWDFISPSLQTVSGIAVVSYVGSYNTWTKIAKFHVKCEPGMIGYSSLDDKEGIPSNILNAIKPYLDIMLRSYQQGVCMHKDNFGWIIEEDLDITKDALKKIPDIAEKRMSELSKRKR